ncbi:MAG: DUF3794 domain-containing protein [Lachnospiraceae bacterium]|nr:DUF3794 domain-containing protein [Lachnospiraceae bacterium]
MELEKRIIHKNENAGKAFSQITLDDDYNLPDYKPDLTKVIRERGKLHFDEIRINSGHILMKGVLRFQILYRTDLDGKKINYLKGEIPFQENLSIDGIEETDAVKVDGRIEDISVSVINSRKLSIRSLVEFHGVADRGSEEEILTGIKEENTCETERENLDILELVMDKKDTLRIRQELPLSSNKPNIEEILWNSVEPRGVDCYLEEGKIEVAGEALVQVLYASVEDGEHLQWFETTVPIKGSIECSSCTKEQICRIKTELSQVNIEITGDEDGEARVLLLELVMNLEISLWQEVQIEMLSDMYALDRQIQPEFKKTCFEKLMVKNEAKCRVFERAELEEEQEDILQVCMNETQLNIEQMTRTEDGILAEGILTVEILYITADDTMPLSAKKVYIPFHQMLEMPATGENVNICMDGSIDQLTTLLADNRSIDVKAVITLRLLALEQMEKQLITQIHEEELDVKALQQRPGLVGYIVREGDRLFGIAREHHTTVENIIEMNGLSSQQIRPGEKLLIVKTVM